MLPLIEWDDSLVVGHWLIDEHHKDLVNILNILHLSEESRCDVKQVQQMLGKLYKHTAHHFNEEESLMDKTCYKFRIQHELEHDEFLNQIDILVQKVKFGDCHIGEATFNWMISWLKNHVAIFDKQLVECLPNC